MLYTLDPKDSVFIYVNINKYIHLISMQTCILFLIFSFKGKEEGRPGKIKILGREGQ